MITVPRTLVNVQRELRVALQHKTRDMVDDEVLAWGREALQASHADQRRDHQEAAERLRAEHKRKPGLHETGRFG